MRTRSIPFLLVFMLAGFSAFGADAPAATPPPSAPAPAAPVAPGAAQSWNGSLTTKGLSAKDGVVALMEITTGDKVEWVDLKATGDAAKKLDDLATQHAKVTVTGTRAPDAITVTQVGDDAVIPKAKGKKKK